MPSSVLFLFLFRNLTIVFIEEHLGSAFRESVTHIDIKGGA
ncbi:MAG TPA: hypothetical protein DEB17_03225 [Chlorobaculum sp.]|uniref:Uncharacterized protein n=1 Tax=Chlorobaculum tepidum (strain ATCC 49652 / DSM 12025 / NBRC 103806 / TLS) TaxID=194439 RepID=Q8KE46_CHLTE|nr:hypothetical protein CT0844 [Chlorobaculum tepidum TLS]HBU22998.1 hypothetical protein [Chlorobaculum sp.]